MSVGAVQAGPRRRALADLRRARRRRRMAQFDVMEALYRAYVAAIFGGVALWWLALRVGGSTVAHASVHRAVVDGPQVVGLVVALALAIGLRSGGRGGPLVLEAADVRHVLLAPLERGTALRGPGLRLLRFGTAWGAGVGAVIGVLASRRLGGHWATWAACSAMVGAAAVDAALGAAMAVSGFRLRREVAAGLAVVVLGWSAADVVLARAASPMSLLGEAALWPLRWRLGGLAGVALAVLVVAFGVVAAAGISVEASERRASLAGQLRFAVTVRDLRTVILLRRQLAQESARVRPWLQSRRALRLVSGARGEPPPSLSPPSPLSPSKPPPKPSAKPKPLSSTPAPPGRRSAGAPAGSGRALWRRSWQGLLRFPAMRLARLAFLGAAAGAAAVGVWRGTTPLVLAAGVALYIAGLDVIEPAAQAVDHPALLESYPLQRGSVLVGLLTAPLVAMLAVGVVGAATAFAIAGGDVKALKVGAVLLVPASLAALAGTAISTVQGSPALFGDSDMLLPPEAVGAKVLVRTLWPPVVATVGVLPLLAARSQSGSPLPAAVGTAVPVLLLVALVLLWVRHHDALHRAIKEAMGGAKRKA